MVSVTETLQEHWPKILITFLIGGAVLAAVEFIAKYADNPALAAVAGAFPVGLISMYLVQSSQSQKYAHDYFFITSILLFSVLMFYIIRTNMTTWGEMQKKITVTLVVIMYIILVYFRSRVATKDNV